MRYAILLPMSDYYTELGNNIRKFREEHGYTQDELGHLLGDYSPSAISYFEKGERKPRIEEISKLSEIFEVDINEILPKTEAVSSNEIKFRKEKEGHKKLDYEQLMKDIKHKKGFKPIKGGL